MALRSDVFCGSASSTEHADDSQWSAVAGVYSVDSMNNDWRMEIRRVLRGFHDLPDDWDSYGSSAPRRSTLGVVADFVNSLNPERISQPSTAPISGGGVQVCWERARVLDLHFLANGLIDVHIEAPDGELPTLNPHARGLNTLLFLADWVHDS